MKMLALSSDWPAGRMEKAVELLRESAGFPEPVIGALLAEANWRSYRQGEVLFRAHTPSDHWMLVLSGSVVLEMPVPGRYKARILSLGAGDFLGWSAALGKTGMTAAAVALEESEIAAFSAESVVRLCESDPQVGYHVMKHVAHTLADRLLATRLQLLDLFAFGQSRPKA